MTSRRAKLSLCQYLELFDPAFLRILLDKHDLSIERLSSSDYVHLSVIEAVEWAVSNAGADQLHGLLLEVFRTQDDLRYRPESTRRHKVRWDDLVRCLELDGYRWDGQNIIAVDPTIEGTDPLDDDLSAELKRSGLPEVDSIVRVLNSSADAFRKIPPDHNACLTNARVALQTLGTAIAKARRPSQPVSFDETKWGEVIAYLRKSGLITVPEEKGLTGVFGFVSPAAHTPVGLSDLEMARLGRSLVAGMCYFLVKRYNG